MQVTRSAEVDKYMGALEHPPAAQVVQVRSALLTAAHASTSPSSGTPRASSSTITSRRSTCAISTAGQWAHRPDAL